MNDISADRSIELCIGLPQLPHDINVDNIMCRPAGLIDVNAILHVYIDCAS